MTIQRLKQGLLLFWAGWLGLVCLTNITDLLQVTGVLDMGRYVSGNYALIAGAVGQGLPPLLLYLLVIAWEGVTAWRFWTATRAYPLGRGPMYRAYAMGIALWAGFMLADEMFLTYSLEAVHARFFIAQMVSLLATVLLPDEVLL